MRNIMMKQHIVKGISAVLWLAVLGSAPLVEAQSIRYTHLKSSVNLGTDLNYVFNYNLYEKCRWGWQFYLLTPFSADKSLPSNAQRQFYADVYGAYGVGDCAFKYGGQMMLRLPQHGVRWQAAYRHDIERTGNLHLHGYNLFSTTENSSYFTSRYSMVDRVSGALAVALGHRSDLTTEVRYSREQYLFDNYQLLFPNIASSPALPLPRNFMELHLNATLHRTCTLDLLSGYTNDTLNRSPYFARFVFQYTDNHKSQKEDCFRWWLQGGFATASTPFSRMFDLSGTAFGYYFFNNTFLTVRPNTFGANLYAHACFSYSTPPLWKSRLSNPCVFLQINAMAGALCANDNLAATATVDGISLQAPTQGVVEPLVGINRLLRWGVLDMGVAAAYQMTPLDAPYHQTQFKNRFAVVGVMTLAVDNFLHFTQNTFPPLALNQE